MKVRSLLLAFILSVLFLAGGTATQAQTLDQTLSGCNGAAPLRTIQANPSNYKSLIPGLLPGDRLQLAAGTYTQGLNLWYKNGEPGKCIVIGRRARRLVERATGEAESSTIKTGFGYCREGRGRT